MIRVYFKREEQLHNAIVWLRRTFDYKLCPIYKRLPKGDVGMLEVSEYQADILLNTYETHS